ncbi:MAG: hypothetical protein L0Y72_08275 [Gemmataceae bacterium]|nr:hypothetical protein [Gemmataceae bacterium]MCI0739025.1 hypothetical protein [Gemmataceae bacterium]
MTRSMTLISRISYSMAMQSNQTKDWVQRLQAGTLELFDLNNFEKLRIEDLVRDLAKSFPVRFLNRLLGRKQEIGLAQNARHSNRWGSRLFVNCLLLTSESERITSVAAITFLRFRPSPQAPGMFSLTSGAGFSVYHDPDGWRIKLMHERTIALRESTLRDKGWVFDGMAETGPLAATVP